jgi:hypothetical protein
VLDELKVYTKRETQKLIGLSGRTWDRLEARGETPRGAVVTPTSDDFRRLLQEISAARTRSEGAALLNRAKGWMLTDLETDLLLDAWKELPSD